MVEDGKALENVHIRRRYGTFQKERTRKIEDFRFGLSINICSYNRKSSEGVKPQQSF